MSELGFDCIDIQPSMLAMAESRGQAQRLGLSVSCLGVSFGLPEGTSLDSPDADARAAAPAYIKYALDPWDLPPHTTWR